MKRIISSVIILTLILIFCCWTVWQIDNICSDLSGILREAEQKCLLGNYEEAEALVLRTRQLWENHKAFLGITLHHSDLGNVSVSFPALMEACRQKNSEEFSMQNQELIAILSNISGLEWPHYYHIL